MYRKGQPQARHGALLSVALLVCVALGCSEAETTPDDGAGIDAAAEAPRGRPNVLWIVWDTVRADRMSLYGHSRRTTPHLDDWAKDALVFDNATSAASFTVPSHASMFTGLMPSEHCAGLAGGSLRQELTTLAEVLREEGYATFLYSENPHISRETDFAQGFDHAEHPWSARHHKAALEILRRKVEDDRSSELSERLEAMDRGSGVLTPWNLKAAGELAEIALLRILDTYDADRPWFAFVNFMEAHRPTIPPRRYRKAFMSREDVAASYEVDRSWSRLWAYTFGHADLSERELELTRATYDAAILELDDLLASLLEALEEAGHLRNTVVVLTSDHGEQLGEQHMLDHQSTLFEPVLRVPLVLWDPTRIAAGRRSDPVTNVDLFPTLLELTESPSPIQNGGAGSGGAAPRSLLSAAPDPDRSRLAEELSVESTGVSAMRRLHRGWDPTPWQRTQRALYRGRYKWIWSSNGAHALYDIDADPREERNLARLREVAVADMKGALQDIDATLVPCESAAPLSALSTEQRRRLELLGYLPSDETGASATPE